MSKIVRCCHCHDPTLDPYRVCPFTNRLLKRGGYCRNCYEILVVRTMRGLNRKEIINEIKQRGA